MTAPGQPYSGQHQPGQTPGGVPPGAPRPGAGQPAPSTQPDNRPKRAVSAGQILGGLLFLIVIVFIIENSRKVKVRLIFPEVTAPLYVPILIAAVLGGLIAALLRFRRHRHHPTR